MKTHKWSSNSKRLATSSSRVLAALCVLSVSWWAVGTCLLSLVSVMVGCGDTPAVPGFCSYTFSTYLFQQEIVFCFLFFLFLPLPESQHLGNLWMVCLLPPLSVGGIYEGTGMPLPDRVCPFLLLFLPLPLLLQLFLTLLLFLPPPLLSLYIFFLLLFLPPLGFSVQHQEK